jgi:rhodanese-related sulfurtransferase/CBS domain-containing protein
MFEKIDYHGVRRLLDEGAQLVEVLPREEYTEEHLPGAINIPLKELDRDSAAQLDKKRPVVVYCWNQLCDMSPRAGALLDRFGFERVFDYAASKVDYLARGLPREGEKAGERRAVDAIRDEVVSCAPGEAIEEARTRIDSSPFGFGLVVNEGGVVLGRLRRSLLQQSEGGVVEEVMEVGPSTVRANVRAEELRERLEQRELRCAIVTTPDGVLLGVVRRADL